MASIFLHSNIGSPKSMAMHIHSLPYNIQFCTPIIATLSIIVLITFINSVHGRIIRINSSDDHLITDGIDHVDDQSLVLTTNDVLVSACTCQHAYGFLPCAENAGGYIFQILVYQGLLIFGEMQVSIGSKVFFKILEKKFNTSKYVGIIFRILMELPAMMMVILSGVFSSKENARSQVSLGVGIYAGITVFTLTLQWGICLIYGLKKQQKKPKSEDSESQASCWSRVRELNGTCVKLQKDPCKVARIMLLSLIPYIIVQLVDIFNASHIVLLIAFIVSAAYLLSYFIYQTTDEWMQKLSSEYVEYDILREAFLKHVEQWGKLVDDDGNPNFGLIKILFDETDKDGDKHITSSELKKLFDKIMPEMSDDTIKNAVVKSMESFDFDHDNKINQTEFTKACVSLAHEGDFISRELLDKDFEQFSRMEINKLEIDPIMSKLLMHAESQLLGESLIMANGDPNIDTINNLFKQYDNDNDNKISRKDLKRIIRNMIEKKEFGNLNPKSKDVVNKLFFNLDTDGSNMIEKEEFVNGLQNWLRKAIDVAKCPDDNVPKSVEEFDKIVWKKLKSGHTYQDFVECVFRIVLGIVILTFIAGPLTASILQLSYAMRVPSFSISFVIVPLAMNTRTLIEALFPVSKKTEKTASLTFSEIYSKVTMNNISNLTTLLAVVYAKDLPWDYSAEILTILVVCAVIGILGSSTIKYHFWTCLLAFLLYPFSLALYCFVEFVLHWN